jgi:hypothetical protein
MVAPTGGARPSPLGDEYHYGVRFTPRARRLVIAAVVVTSTAGVATGVSGCFLRALGGILVAEDPLQPTDAIVVTVNSGFAGIREAAALVSRGVARRVAVFAETELADPRTGRYVNDRRVWELSHLGVPEVEVLPAVRGTTDTGPAVARWTRSHGLRSITVVSLPDHSRRVRRVMQRALRGSGTTVIVRVAPYELFTPDNWWQEPAGRWIGLAELGKLLIEVTLHP